MILIPFYYFIPTFMFFLHNPLEMINICVTITTYNYHTIFFFDESVFVFPDWSVFLGEKLAELAMCID